MWIRTQNRQRIINTNQVVDIFVGARGNTIYAEPACEQDMISLGEYKDRNECLKVIDIIHACFDVNIKTLVMPLGGEVETWAEEIDKIATINIAHGFIK